MVAFTNPEGPLFQVEEVEGGLINVRNVPIFRTHADRNYKCDEEWLDRCIADFQAQRAEAVAIAGDEKFAMLPSVTIGHTPTNPDAPEPPCVGALDNLRRHGEVLYGDLVGISPQHFQQMREGRFPYRSVEVIPSKHRLTNVSLLGGRYPHFALPIMRFRAEEGGEEVEVVRYTLRGPMIMADKTDKNLLGSGGFGGGGVGVSGGGGGQIDVQALAKAVAPIVAQLLTEAQANAGGGPAPGAYGSRDKVARHAVESEADQTKGGPVEMKPNDEVPKGDKEAVKAAGEDAGTPAKDPTKQAEEHTLQEKIDRLTEQVEHQAEVIQQQGETIDSLQKHTHDSLAAAKRAMLTSKVKEIAALGYAVGDKEAIDRHVARMMELPNEGVKQYIDDVLKNMPKVRAEVERHGTGDGIVRPGSGGDENQRYYDDNADVLSRVGIESKDVLDLADLLG